ncbi:MAG: hypothetical protein ACYDBP_05400 [Leptospirales bacterium]
MKRQLIFKGIRGGILAVVALFLLSITTKSFAQTSGPGAVDVLLFGNYDLTSVNTASLYSNAPAGFNSQWNKAFNNGTGGGLGIVVWLSDNLALRVEGQANTFTTPLTSSTNILGALSMPITGGVEVKLLGNADDFLYLTADVGAAYENDIGSLMSSLTHISPAWSAYADAGIGFNLDWIFLEVKVAYLPDTFPNSYYSQNPLWYIPVTAGFNF